MLNELLIIGLVVAAVIVGITVGTSNSGEWETNWDSDLPPEEVNWVIPENGFQVRRLVPCNEYETLGLDESPPLPNARTVSNTVFNGANSPDQEGFSALLAFFGQFIDHEITLAMEGSPSQPSITIPVEDPADIFRQNGITELHVSRTTQTLDENNCAVQTSLCTAFLDGSAIYGNTQELAQQLKEEDGRLKSQIINGEEFMPYKNDNATDWLAGDIRAAETIPLTVFHTLFVRNHNWWVEIIKSRNPGWTGSQIFHQARLVNVAELQKITVEEWLPIILGYPIDLNLSSNTIDAEKNRIFQEFIAAGFRYGHSQIPDNIGSTPLVDLFMNPNALVSRGLDEWLTDLKSTAVKRVDAQVIDTLRNVLFGSIGMDLVTFNIVRGRSLELPTKEEMERFLAGNASSSSGSKTELFEGLLSESRGNDTAAVLPPTLTSLVERQFKDIIEGDDKYFRRREAQIGSFYMEFINSVTLSELINRNSAFKRRGISFPKNAFEL